MKKSMQQSACFYSFILLVGSILAVLGFVLGQLFPFYAKYILKKYEASTRKMIQVIEERDITLTD